MGATGFLYASAKDNLKWQKLSLKRWLGIVLDVGYFMALDKEQWQKVKKGRVNKSSDIAGALKSAFGDGTKSK